MWEDPITELYVILADINNRNNESWIQMLVSKVTISAINLHQIYQVISINNVPN